MLRQLLRLSATALVGLLILGGLGQPAQAGGAYPACGVTCDDKDPAGWKWYPFGNKTYIYCASDATTVRSVQYGTWRAELRYSNNCETTWVRMIDLNIGSRLPTQINHVSKYLNGTTRRSVWNAYVPPATNWTTMLDDHNLSNHVCLYVYASEWDLQAGNPEYVGCTAGY